MRLSPGNSRVRAGSRTGLVFALVVPLIVFIDPLPVRAVELAPEIPRVLRLEDAHRAAVAANPERAAALWGVRAVEGRAVDRVKWPNPQLDTEFENWGSSLGSDILETAVGVSQRFELGGDRAARADASASTVDAARAGLGVLDGNLRERVTLDFVAAWVAQEKLWKLREARRIADAAVVAAEGRIKAGAASPVEKTRARSNLSLVEADLVRADAAFAAARRALALRWGAAEAAFDSLDLSAPVAEAGERVSAQELATHPAITGAEAETAVAAARVRAARAHRIPDIDLRVGVRRINELNATAWVAGVSLPLPVWNSHPGELTAAEADHARTQAQRGAVERRLRAEYENAQAELLAAVEAHTRLELDAMPAAEDALATLQAGYRAGHYSYVELVEGQRAALESGFAVVEAVAGVWRAIARLESLVGVHEQTGGLQ